MSPLAIMPKAKSTPDSQTIDYETYRKQSVIIVQRDYQLDEWVAVNHMDVPNVIFDFIQSFRFEKDLLKGAHNLLDVVTSYFREFSFRQDTLDDGVQNVFDNNDVKNWTPRKPRGLLERSWTGRKHLEKQTRYWEHRNF